MNRPWILIRNFLYWRPFMHDGRVYTNAMDSKPTTTSTNGKRGLSSMNVPLIHTTSKIIWSPYNFVADTPQITSSIYLWKVTLGLHTISGLWMLDEWMRGALMYDDFLSPAESQPLGVWMKVGGWDEKWAWGVAATGRDCVKGWMDAAVACGHWRARFGSWQRQCLDRRSG